MSQKITATHERVDIAPAIIAHLKKWRGRTVDTHFPTNGNWEELSLGWTTVVWLAFLLSEGDHRLIASSHGSYIGGPSIGASATRSNRAT